jgi:hypothetical protein
VTRETFDSVEEDAAQKISESGIGQSQLNPTLDLVLSLCLVLFARKILFLSLTLPFFGDTRENNSSSPATF